MPPPLVSSAGGRFGRASQPTTASSRETPALRRPWSRQEAKRAHAEHLAAERDLMAVVTRAREDKRKESEKLRRPKVKWVEPAPFPAVVAVLTSPLALSLLGLAAGYTSMTVMTLGGASAIMLALILGTPATDPTISTTFDSPMASGHSLKSLQLGASDEHADFRQELVTVCTIMLMGATGIAQVLVLVFLTPLDWRNSVNFGVSITCASGLVLLASDWVILTLIRKMSSGGIVSSELNQIASRYRQGRQNLFFSAEVEVRAAIDRRKANQYAQLLHRNAIQQLKKEDTDLDEVPELRADGSFRFRSLDSPQKAKLTDLRVRDEGRWANVQARALNVLDTAGRIIRHSPLKSVIVLVDFAIALEGLEDVHGVKNLPTHSIVALCAAIITLLSMSDYVRSVADNIEYADCLRWESERRQLNLNRRTVEESLRRSLQEGVDEIDVSTFEAEIESGEEQRVSEPLIREARSQLEFVVQLREKQEAERLMKQEEDKARREAAEARLAEAVTDATARRDHANLGDLMVALDAARAEGVQHDLITRAEKVLKQATHRQGVRMRAEAKLQFYLAQHDDGDGLSDSTPAGSRSASPVPISIPPPQTSSSEAASAPAPAEAGAIVLASEKKTVDGAEDAEAEEGEQEIPTPPAPLLTTVSFQSRASNPLATMDVKEMDLIIEEAREYGVDPELIERVLNVRSQIVQSQVGVLSNAAMFSVKLKHRTQMSKWRRSGGSDRLTKATQAGSDALKLLRGETEAGPLSTAVEGLALAVQEAKQLELPEAKVTNIQEATELLEELRSAADALSSAHQFIESAMNSVDDLSSYAKIAHSYKLLSDAIPLATLAYVDRTLVAKAKDQLKRVQSKLRAAAAADEKLKEAQTFLDEHLRYFHARRKSQLKVVAIPVLAEAISRARVAMVLPERVKEAENKLDEAKLVQGRAEEAAQELTAAVTSAVKALERASADPEQAQETLSVAIETLQGALADAGDSGADGDDIANAEQLLLTLLQSGRRASKDLSSSSLPVHAISYAQLSEEGPPLYSA